MTKLNSLVQKIRALVSPFAVPETLVILVLILFAGFSRLIPHPWNFTAIGAMALFSGHQFQHKVLAFVAPFLTLLWTDTVLGFHDTMVFVYFSVALVTLMGFWTQNSVSRVIGGSLFGSTLFFLITNFGVWYTQGLYPKTGEGLLQSYLMGIPFFHYQVLGDLFYSAVLFGALAALKSLGFIRPHLAA